jgi:hypothetical protein
MGDPFGEDMERDGTQQTQDVEGALFFDRSPGVSQAEVSKMERRRKFYIGTLRKFTEAMNDELVLAARFDDGVEVPIRLIEAEAAA